MTMDTSTLIIYFEDVKISKQLRMSIFHVSLSLETKPWRKMLIIEIRSALKLSPPSPTHIAQVYNT